MSKIADLPASHDVLTNAFRRNRLLLSLVLLQIACAIAVGFYVDRPFWDYTTPRLLVISFQLLCFMFANFILWRLGVAIFSVKPKKPIQWMLQDLRAKLSDTEKAPDAVIGYVSIVAMIMTFMFLKDEIHALNPSLWDTQFANWDRFLHGGVDPWTLLWPILGSPYVTTAVNLAYHIWFPMMYIAVCVACLDRRDPIRSTVYLVSFALSWFVGGNILATVFASVGPVYFEPFNLGTDFVPQMELLRQSNEISPVWALDVQRMLLEGYQNAGLARGISAMPSMHVCSSVLLALYAFTYSRWLGWAMTAFAVVIVMGSVHLAWHYAVDGYASIILAFVFWWLSKRLTARFGPST